MAEIAELEREMKRDLAALGTRIDFMERAMPSDRGGKPLLIGDGHPHAQAIEGLDEGVSQGFGYRFDAVGTGVSLTRSGRTLTLTVSAGGGAHDLLSTPHADTLAAAVSRGSMIVGNSTPAWSELVIGASGTYPRSDGTDLVFSTIDADAIAAVEGEATLNLAGDVFIANLKGLVVGHTAQIDFGATPEFQVLGTGTPDSSMGFARFENNASGPDVRFLKSRGATIGTNVIVNDNDTLGRFRFQGADGGDFNTTAAEVLGRVDGTPGLNDIPGRLVFRTRISGGGLADRAIIDNVGNLNLLTGTFFLTEQADANADVAGRGQIWINTATPNELFFTDDAGTDEQVVLASQVQDSKYVFAVDAEASDTYVISLTPAVAAYAAGQMFLFDANTVNTGAATLNVNGLGAKTIKKEHDVDLSNGDIEAGQLVLVGYDGTNFQMLSLLGNAPGGGGGGQDLATDTLWAAAGDLVKGTGNDAADILSIGADHTILVSNGSVPSWSARPPLVGLADTADVARLDINTSSPHVDINDDLRVQGRMSIDSAVDQDQWLTVSPTVTGVTAWVGIGMAPTITISGSSRQATGFQGTASINVPGSTSGHIFKGMDFNATIAPQAANADVANLYGANAKGSIVAFASGGATKSTTVDELFNIRSDANLIQIIGSGATSTAAATIADLAGFVALAPAFSVTSITSATVSLDVTRQYGMWVKGQSLSNALITIATYYGARIEDSSGTSFTTVHLVEVGPSTPYFRVVGDFTAAANRTSAWFSEGATPTLRQLQTFDPGSGGANFVGGELVCLLV